MVAQAMYKVIQGTSGGSDELNSKHHSIAIILSPPAMSLLPTELWAYFRDQPEMAVVGAGAVSQCEKCLLRKHED